MSKIAGSLSDDSRLLIYDTNDNSLVVDEVVNSGDYSFGGLTIFDKHVMAVRESDGKTIGYGNVTPIPSPDPVNVIFSPVTQQDDGYGREPDRMYNQDILMGYTGTHTYKTYARFPGISIPKNATISSAYVRWVVYDRYLGSVVMSIACENVDDSAALTTWDNFKNRPLTSSPVTWNFSTSGNSNGDIKNTPSIKDAVQSIVNRSGWVSGNALLVAFTYVSGGFLSFYPNVAGDPFDPPQLRITYIEF